LHSKQRGKPGRRVSKIIDRTYGPGSNDQDSEAEGRNIRKKKRGRKDGNRLFPESKQLRSIRLGTGVNNGKVRRGNRKKSEDDCEKGVADKSIRRAERKFLWKRTERQDRVRVPPQGEG